MEALSLAFGRYVRHVPGHAWRGEGALPHTVGCDLAHVLPNLGLEKNHGRMAMAETLIVRRRAKQTKPKADSRALLVLLVNWGHATRLV